MAAAGEFGTASARTLADILAEAGIEATGRGGRRRRSEPDPSEPEPAPAGPELAPAGIEQVGVDIVKAGNAGADTAEVDTAEVDTAEVDNDRADTAEVDTAEVDNDRADTAEVDTAGADTAEVDNAEAEIDAAEQARSEPEGETLVVPGQPLPQSRGRHGQPARAPVPEGSAARGWSLLIVEVVLVAFLGVLLWYGFSVLWELYPYAAAVAAPGVLAGIVGVGQLLRARRGLPPLPGSVVFALLLVGTVLAVLPAAAVLARS